MFRLNKKGEAGESDGSEELVLEFIVFVVVVISVFSILFLSVYIKSNNAGYYEQAYAKQIALDLDKAKPGTKIEIDVSQMYALASQNNFYSSIITPFAKKSDLPDLVRIDNNNKKVIVNLASVKGYSFDYYNAQPVTWQLDKGSKKLTMEIA